MKKTVWLVGAVVVVLIAIIIGRFHLKQPSRKLTQPKTERVKLKIAEQLPEGHVMAEPCISLPTKWRNSVTALSSLNVIQAVNWACAMRSPPDRND